MNRIAVVVAGLLAAHVSTAMAQTPTRVRGVIEQVSEQAMAVKSRDGQNSAVTRMTLADIKPGSFIGTAAVRQPDGTFRALEVLVFPEAMRGTGEGHFAWDLAPESTMTNATVDAVLSHVDGPLLTLTYKGGEVKVAVPADTPVVTVGPGDRSWLVAGAAVFLSASRAADGSLSAARVLVGKDGVVPPM